MTETELIEAENETTNSEETEEENCQKSGFTHTVRHKDGGTVTIKNYNKTKAIKLWCSECEGFEGDPKKCVEKLCPLFPYKGNTLANRSRAVFKGNSNIEQLKKAREAAAMKRKKEQENTDQV